MITRAQARAELRACAARLGRSPSMRDFAADPQAGCHPQAISRLYPAGPGRPGGWNAAKRDAGLPVLRHIADQEMLEALAGLAARLGARPTARQIAADPSVPSAGLYLQRFGSLREACARAGVPSPAPASGAGDIVSQGVRLLSRLGHPPSWGEWQAAHASGEIPASPWQAYRRFGGGTGAWDLLSVCILDAAG